jgi:hypothetical protein
VGRERALPGRSQEIEMCHPVKAGIAMVLAALAMSGQGQAQTADPAASRARADAVDRLLSSEVRPTSVTVNDGEAYHRADDAQQDPAEVRTTQALNDEIVSRNQLAENQERADREAYEAKVAQAPRERLAYEEAARQADAARRRWDVEREAAERARAQYAADLLACRAGVRARCLR